MIIFECDYAEGAHPQVMELLNKTNMDQTPGYGLDPYCDKAREIIKKLIGNQQADVHFLVGGTQTNATVIASVLRPHQGVISAVSGHINAHETGAIEATGHKVIALASTDGKITAQQVLNEYNSHWGDATHEHIVQPGMVYISNPTETGTLYTKGELEDISRACRECDLVLFMDGARLGYGLMAEGNDLDVKDIARLCDIFYIGGTKVGALFGEAVVITKKSLNKDFRYFIKQNGGMLAKGRLLGVQFIALLENGLYFDIAKQADDLAIMIKEAFEAKGCKFLHNSVTNQQFPIVADDKLEILGKKYSFSFIQRMDETHSAVRFCTSWATKKEDVLELVKDIKSL